MLAVSAGSMTKQPGILHMGEQLVLPPTYATKRACRRTKRIASSHSLAAALGVFSTTQQSQSAQTEQGDRCRFRDLRNRELVDLPDVRIISGPEVHLP